MQPCCVQVRYLAVRMGSVPKTRPTPGSSATPSGITRSRADLPSGVLPTAMRTISSWVWLSSTSWTISQFTLAWLAAGQATRQEP